MNNENYTDSILSRYWYLNYFGLHHAAKYGVSEHYYYIC
jgi:hypothetical protein